MKNSYKLRRECCEYNLIKQEALKIRDNSTELSRDVSFTQMIADRNPLAAAGDINGRLFYNLYIYRCLCCICPCCTRMTTEVSGYHTKLSETEKIHKCCQCFPDFEMRDRDQRILGTFVTNCPYFPCRKPLEIHTGRDYIADTDCCYYCCCSFFIYYNCCGIKWDIKDTLGNKVSDIEFTTCLGLESTYQINYYGDLPVNDRIAILSSIPYLY